ncbi:BHLH domain-containing protein [Psidium guajava]|nr:BHLH domain-containing protein [Psidium guajava]
MSTRRGVAFFTPSRRVLPDQRRTDIRHSCPSYDNSFLSSVPTALIGISHQTCCKRRVTYQNLHREVMSLSDNSRSLLASTDRDSDQSGHQ